MSWDYGEIAYEESIRGKSAEEAAQFIMTEIAPKEDWPKVIEGVNLVYKTNLTLSQIVIDYPHFVPVDQAPPAEQPVLSVPKPGIGILGIAALAVGAYLLIKG